MKKTEIDITLTFVEDVLGSASGNKDLHEEFIAAKATTATAAKEELDALQVAEEIQKSSTVFPRDPDNGNAVMAWDYQVRGFFKEAIGALIELGDCPISKWGYKKAVDSFLFVRPRKIHFRDAAGALISGTLKTLQRPLRADTMQGERVALARSEVIPAGSKLAFKLEVLSGSNGKSKLALITPELVKAALDYGSLKGFGQWRSGGYGRFEYTTEEKA